MDENRAIVPLKTNSAIELFKIGNEYRIDSRIVAKGIGVKHRYFIRLLRQPEYLKRLEKFGVVSFENALPPKGSKGGMPEIYAMLNRNQVAFAITLSRNTDQVVDFKFDLIEAFDTITKGKAIRSQPDQQLYLQPQTFNRSVTLPRPGIHSTTSRIMLTAEDEKALILAYVAFLETPSARDLSRYLLRYPVAYLRRALTDLAQQEFLIGWYTGRTWRYKMPQYELLAAASANQTL